MALGCVVDQHAANGFRTSPSVMQSSRKLAYLDCFSIPTPHRLRLKELPPPPILGSDFRASSQNTPIAIPNLPYKCMANFGVTTDVIRSYVNKPGPWWHLFSFAMPSSILVKAIQLCVSSLFVPALWGYRRQYLLYSYHTKLLLNQTLPHHNIFPAHRKPPAKNTYSPKLCG